LDFLPRVWNRARARSHQRPDKAETETETDNLAGTFQVPRLQKDN